MIKQSEDKVHMSHMMKKHAFCICENMGVNEMSDYKAQLMGTLLHRIIHQLPKSENFKPLAIFRGCTVPFVSDLAETPSQGLS